MYSQTIKDISNVIGIRENQLIGYGLIVGLAGTGDKSKFTMQSLQNLLRNSYIKIPAGSINYLAYEKLKKYAQVSQKNN